MHTHTHTLTGLFSCIMRDLANTANDSPKWIVLDGDIDPMWIESLNTVMDDNKVRKHNSKPSYICSTSCTQACTLCCELLTYCNIQQTPLFYCLMSFTTDAKCFLFPFSQVLTLASNERVPLSPSMRLMFEIGHLKAATPATVSRAGILFANPSDLGWNPYVSIIIVTSSV